MKTYTEFINELWEAVKSKLSDSDKKNKPGTRPFGEID